MSTITAAEQQQQRRVLSRVQSALTHPVEVVIDGTESVWSSGAGVSLRSCDPSEEVRNGLQSDCKRGGLPMRL